MNLHLTVPLAQLFLLLRADVLSSEEHNTSLGNEQCELVLLLGCQVLQLEPFNLGADVSRQISYFGCSRQECFLRCVCTSTRIDVLAVGVANLVHVLQIQRSGGTIGISLRQVDPGLCKSSASGFRKTQGVLLGDDDISECGKGGRRHCSLWQIDDELYAAWRMLHECGRSSA